MTAPLSGEKLINLSTACRLFPGHHSNEHIDNSTVFRWVTRGIRTPKGILHLEAVRCAGRWLTSHEAINRFVAAQNQPANNTQAATPSPPATRKRASKTSAKQATRRSA